MAGVRTGDALGELESAWGARRSKLGETAVVRGPDFDREVCEGGHKTILLGWSLF